MSNLENWDKLARPPKEALKNITGGRLKGMTDINPQWRYKAMTEVYGPCGVGWGYRVERTWTEPGQDGQVFAFAQINLFIGQHAPIPGIGGSMLLEKDKYGLHHNDEAFKMAITDALSVAMKMLGVGADIYMGRWDGSKYKESGPHPASGAGIKLEAYESLDAEGKAFIDNLALEVVDLIATDGPKAAKTHIESMLNDTDLEWKNALWHRLDSKTRTALKQHKESA